MELFQVFLILYSERRCFKQHMLHGSLKTFRFEGTISLELQYDRSYTTPFGRKNIDFPLTKFLISYLIA